MARVLLGLLVACAGPGLLAQDSAADRSAQAALQKLAARMREIRTLSASVTQSRRTDLLDKPIVSSGTMAYRRDPPVLAFHLTEPRKADILLDKTSYQVFRPEEKRLERVEFEGEDVTARILMVFEPKLDEIGKTFTVHGGEARDGLIDVQLDSSDERFRKRLKKIVLTLAEADGGLRRIVYTDAEGDEVRFDLSQVVLNPELPADTFLLRTPEGTRVLRRTVKQDK
ncbi:MAG TPA: outer membrane lipoprotein carrier protein LolA [Planctomycetota bacterium]|nr:outer membrane lipoprotein carrier protein LolA [Planctomycetota bacterium]